MIPNNVYCDSELHNPNNVFTPEPNFLTEIGSIGCSNIMKYEQLRLGKIHGYESSGRHYSKAPRSLRCRFSTPPPAPTLKFNCKLAMVANTHVHVFGTTIVLGLDSIALTVGAPIPNTFLPYEVATSPTTLNMRVVQNDWRIQTRGLRPMLSIVS